MDPLSLPLGPAAAFCYPIVERPAVSGLAGGVLNQQLFMTAL